MVKNTLVNLKSKVRRNSPEILIVAGIVGVIGAAVMACRATTKLPDVLDDLEEKLTEINEKSTDDEEKGLPKENIDKTARREKMFAIAGTSVRVAKLYAPAVMVGALSIASIVQSNNIQRKRNAALTATCFAVEQSFKDYRNRVIARFGEEVDSQLKTGIEHGEYEETTIDSKGKEKTTKKKVDMVDPNGESLYVKYFTRMNPYWVNDPDQLQLYFRATQNYLNDKLKVNGHVVLNEAYNALGFHDTKAGMVCGWVKDNSDGDGYIDLKIYKANKMNEYGDLEEVYVIDFNVDGCIYDKMF